MDALTVSSVERLLQKIQQLTARPVPDFSKYEALALVEALKNAASDVKNEQTGYYKLAYETLRGKMSEPDEIFRNYLLPLLGDKDQEKITAIITRVDKNDRRARSGSAPATRQMPASPYQTGRCFYCDRFGHFRASCPQRRRDMERSPNTWGAAGPANSRPRRR